MDYKERAKELLSRRNDLISAHSFIKNEMTQLEQEIISLKTLISNAEIAPNKEENYYEGLLINLLADMEDCRFRKSVVERELTKIEKGLEGLNDYQKDLIITFFIEHPKGGAEDLMFRWMKERSSVYRDRNSALETFTRSIYGVLQI